MLKEYFETRRICPEGFAVYLGQRDDEVADIMAGALLEAGYAVYEPYERAGAVK